MSTHLRSKMVERIRLDIGSLLMTHDRLSDSFNASIGIVGNRSLLSAMNHTLVEIESTRILLETLYTVLCDESDETYNRLKDSALESFTIVHFCRLSTIVDSIPERDVMTAYKVFKELLESAKNDSETLNIDNL